MECPVRNIQPFGKEHLPFSRRIVPDVPLVSLACIAPQHIGGDFPMRYILPVIRIVFHKGVHKFIRNGDGSLHPASVVDRMQFEIICPVSIAAITVFVSNQCRLGHHYLFKFASQFIHIVHFRSYQLYVL